MNQWMNKDKCREGRIDGDGWVQVDGSKWMDGWMENGWTDGQMDNGWMDNGWVMNG